MNFATIDEFRVYFEREMETRYRPVAGALATYAAWEKDTGEHVFLTARWEFFDEKQPARSRLDYGRLTLEERWIPGDRAAAELIEVLGGQRSMGAPLRPISFSSLYTDDYRSGIQEPGYSGWPEFQIRASVHPHERLDLPYGPLVRRGLRPYSHRNHAVNVWVWGEARSSQWTNSSIAEQSGIRIIIPDTRARFVDAQWAGGDLEIRVERTVAADALEIQVVQRAQSGGARVDLISPAGSGEIVHLLVAEDANGIVAFANSTGGRIYMGILDRGGTPEGRSALLKAINTQDQRMTSSDALLHLGEWVKKAISDKIKPTPEYTIANVFLKGEPVLMCRVATGSMRPYATHVNDIFIRKGSTNRKPDPQTELPALLRQNNAVAFGNWGL